MYHYEIRQAAMHAPVLVQVQEGLVVGQNEAASKAAAVHPEEYRCNVQ